MARNASGEDGNCFEYIQKINIRCKKLEIKDEYVQKMWEAINYDVPTP
jgi:cation transport regulator ChaC